MLAHRCYRGFRSTHKHLEDTINRINQLAITMSDKQIVNQLNKEGLVTNRGK